MLGLAGPEHPSAQRAKDIAYANVITTVFSRTVTGMVPNYRSGAGGSTCTYDRTEPMVGSWYVQQPFCDSHCLSLDLPLHFSTAPRSLQILHSVFGDDWPAGKRPVHQFSLPFLRRSHCLSFCFHCLSLCVFTVFPCVCFTAFPCVFSLRFLVYFHCLSVSETTPPFSTELLFAPLLGWNQWVWDRRTAEGMLGDGQVKDPRSPTSRCRKMPFLSVLDDS